MRWLGAGLTALLAVLFVVLLQQVRQQGQRLQALQDRLQQMENARDLERTNALEEQLRSTVVRLQNLEGLEQSLQRLSSEQDSLRQQIRSAGSRTAIEPGLEPLLPLEPSQPGTTGSGRNRMVRPPMPPPLPSEQP
jgi:TolA-binding protein